MPLWRDAGGRPGDNIFCLLTAFYDRTVTRLWKAGFQILTGCPILAGVRVSLPRFSQIPHHI
jgi:hypothetical protein